MAEAILNKMGQGRFKAVSAGSNPAAAVHPLTIYILKERGYPVLNLRSKSLEEFRDQKFDLVITVCDSAKEACPVWPGAKMIHWNFEDPYETTGSDEEKMIMFRKIFDQIEHSIRDFIAQGA
jgi:arsenate reductase